MNIQWTTHDNKIYRPVGKTIPALPAACYKIMRTMDGSIFFERQDLRNNELIKLPDTSSNKVIEEIQKFWKSKNKFIENKMPYKRGILMYGPPGSGKTCTLREIMEDIIKKDGIILEFNYSNDFLSGYNSIREIHKDRPIIVVLEDLDAIIRRNNESEFLNIIDGMHNLDNIVFVATTNYPEQLGSRIFNRPSRFDRRHFIGMPNQESRKTYLEHKGIRDPELSRWVKDTKDLSIAHLAELCIAVKILDESYENAIKVIKGMQSIPHSSLFDKSIIEINPGKCYSEAKEKINKKLIKESKLIKGNKTIIRKPKTYIDEIAESL